MLDIWYTYFATQHETKTVLVLCSPAHFKIVDFDQNVASYLLYLQKCRQINNSSKPQLKPNIRVNLVTFLKLIQMYLQFNWTEN